MTLIARKRVLRSEADPRLEMLRLLEVIVAPELGVASSHRVGGFQQVVAEVAVAGFNHPEVFRLEVTGLVFVPDKTGKLGNRGLYRRSRPC